MYYITIFDTYTGAGTVEGNDDESRRVVFLVLVWADHRQGQPVLP